MNTFKRRKFFGFSAFGFGGFSLLNWIRPRAADQPGAKTAGAISGRSDSLQEKIRLLEQAWQKKDFRVARALTHSLRSTILQAQAEEMALGVPLVPSSQFGTVESLASSWRDFAAGWKFYKTFELSETAGQPRSSEPVEILLAFLSEQATSLRRELRIARVLDGALIETHSQVFDEARRGRERFCRVLFQADSSSRQKQTYMVFFGNPNAELPEYPSDLQVTGAGVALDIENAHFKASLSRQTGQLERITLKREHGLEIFSGGEGHGEPAGIDWAHDYVDADSFQKFRITLWDECPDFEVIRGPLCIIVRRWGFPFSPVHPLFSPSRLNVYIEYRFYAGLPWFHKIGAMQAVKDFETAGLRDDEWVFSGQSFTDKVWMPSDGKLRIGDVDPAQQENLWGVGFFHRETKDAFIALFLEHAADGLPELKHNGSPTLSYHWHGQLWSRSPLPVKKVPAGAVLRQKNAYVIAPFTVAEGPSSIESLRLRLRKPLIAAKLETPSKVSAKSSDAPLARPGESGDTSLKRKVWEALRDCKDAQLYTADINVVDLGLVYDVRVRGDVVELVMAMPHRGRPRLDYFVHGSISVHPTPSIPIRERLMKIPGVRQVAVKQVWNPPWSSNELTDEGRKKLGLA